MKKIIIDFKKLVASPCGTKEIVNVDSEIPSPDKKNIEIKTPLYGTLKITNLEKEILTEFNFKLKITLRCCRCGEYFSKIINLKNQKTYKLSELIKDQKLDILPEINEEIILSIPAKSLCKEECKGLCSVCGKNLNNNNCNCQVKIRVDNSNKPFANLKILLESPDACSRDSDKNVGGEKNGRTKEKIN